MAASCLPSHAQPRMPKGLGHPLRAGWAPSPPPRRPQHPRAAVREEDVEQSRLCAANINYPLTALQAAIRSQLSDSCSRPHARGTRRQGAAGGTAGTRGWPWGRVPVLCHPPGVGDTGKGSKAVFFSMQTGFIFGGVLPSSGAAGFVHPLCSTLRGFSSSPAVGEEEVGEIRLFLIDFSPPKKTNRHAGGKLFAADKGGAAGVTGEEGFKGRRPLPTATSRHFGLQTPQLSIPPPPIPRVGKKAGKAMPGEKGRDFWGSLGAHKGMLRAHRGTQAPPGAVHEHPSSRPPGHSELLNEINERGRPARR